MIVKAKNSHSRNRCDREDNFIEKEIRARHMKLKFSETNNSYHDFENKSCIHIMRNIILNSK